MERTKMWTIDGKGGAAELAATPKLDSEKMLEDTLVNNPSMLDPDIALVGRQTSNSAGYLDLLGIDADGRLVLFELKRGNLARDVITQAIDYASALEAKPIDALVDHLASSSGVGGIMPIPDFGSWYAENFPGHDLADLVPIRIVLIGLGVDPATERMARWLQSDGHDVDIITFHAFEHNGETLLGRTLEVSSDEPRTRRPSTGPRTYGDPLSRAREFGAEELYRACHDLIAGVLADFKPSENKMRNGQRYDIGTLSPENKIELPVIRAVAAYVRIEGQGEVHFIVHDPFRDLDQNRFNIFASALDGKGVRYVRTQGDWNQFRIRSLEQFNDVRDDIYQYLSEVSELRRSSQR